jgi:hypothetical protein
MKSVAIMQPYFFPYLGYFQLIDAVDKFVCFDDVNYIKKGWINRNQILVDGQPHMFTIPLTGASQNRKINELNLNDYSKWSFAFLKMVQLNYAKCTQYEVLYPWLEELLNRSFIGIAELNYTTIIEVLKLLGMDFHKVQATSSSYKNQSLSAQERILDICLQEQANKYVNPIGGQELYQKEFFSRRKVELSFLKSNSITYPQKSDIFVPYMSILDVLFNVSKHEIVTMLKNYELIVP